MKTIVTFTTSLSGSCPEIRDVSSFPSLAALSPATVIRARQPARLPGSSSHQSINLTKRLKDDHREERERGNKNPLADTSPKHKEKQRAGVSVETSMRVHVNDSKIFQVWRTVQPNRNF